MVDNAVDHKKLGSPTTTLIAPVTPLLFSIYYRVLSAADDLYYGEFDALTEAERLFSHVEVFAKLIRVVLT